MRGVSDTEMKVNAEHFDEEKGEKKEKGAELE